MLTPEKVDAWVTRHFDSVTEEEFLRDLKRSLPPEEWGQIHAQIVRRRTSGGVGARARGAMRKPFLTVRPKPAHPAPPK